MDREKALDVINQVKTDHDIINRKFKGMNILNDCCDELSFAACHDQIYVCDFDSTVGKLTEEDVEKLASYGFFEEEDSWSFFT